jgi:hypothetical protein
VSDATQKAEAVASVLDADDRAWLEARLRDYRELLAYLHEH